MRSWHHHQPHAPKIANDKENRIGRVIVELTKYCVGVEILVIPAKLIVAVRNWRIEICIIDEWWTRPEQFRSKSEVSRAELSE